MALGGGNVIAQSVKMNRLGAHDQHKPRSENWVKLDSSLLVWGSYFRSEPLVRIVNGHLRAGPPFQHRFGPELARQGHRVERLLRRNNDWQQRLLEHSVRQMAASK